MDRRLGVSQPPGFPFNLNSAVDFLLKKEFDFHRAKNQQHPLMAHYGIEAIPFQHDMMDIWRENFKGVEYLHKPTNLIIGGAVDDLWVNPQGELIVVDYKSTAKDGEVNLDAEWQRGYKNQMEIYQWLFKMNGYKVSEVGYFVYCNGRRDKEAFDAKLEFNIKLIPYSGNTDWVEKLVFRAHECLNGLLPDFSKNCDYCNYRKAASGVENIETQVVSSLPKTEEVAKPVKVKKPKTDSLSKTLF